MESFPALDSSIYSYLKKHFIFRKIGLCEYFKENQIFWNFRDEPFESDPDTDPCDFLRKGLFENWIAFSQSGLKRFAEKFLMEDHRFRRRYTITQVKEAIILAIEEQTTTIQFDPLLAECINEGRHKVTKVTPLRNTDSDRKRITLRKGQKCYLSESFCKPYLANPAYVYKDFGDDSYGVIFFINVNKEGQRTNRIKVNDWDFAKVYGNDVGLTPEQAVLQRLT